MLQVHEFSTNPRRERKDDRCRIAARISQQCGALNGIGMQFRQPVNGGGIELRRAFGESVHLAVLCLLKSPGAAEVNHAKPLADSLWNQLARKLVGRRKENNVNPGVFHPLPRETLEGKAAVAGQLRIGIGQVAVGAAFAIAPEQQRFLHSVVAREQAHQFKSRIAGGAKDSGLDACMHFYATYPRMRCASLPANFELRAIAKIVSSPPMVPTTSSHSSASIAADTG